MTHKISLNGVPYLLVEVPKAIDYFYHPKQNMIECLIAYGGYDRSLGEEVGSDIDDIMVGVEGDFNYVADTRHITQAQARYLLNIPHEGNSAQAVFDWLKSHKVDVDDKIWIILKVNS